MARQPYRRPLAEMLDHLFNTGLQDDGTPYSYEQAAEEITRQGTPISNTTLWRLRTGKTDKVTVQHLAAIAEFFGLDIAYFFDAGYAAQAEVELGLRLAMANSDLRILAVRAGSLSELGRQSLINIAGELAKMEGKPVMPELEHDSRRDGTQ
ncbi:hypothetical protein ACIBG8_07490 [Nonomuraea sp. NPDC050556]|uniref:hypothetical protein n=1 Tax=Nonomuraea sp. NPDC050556 TaxID=3364369 RepID=UPI0037A44798